jgi:predicted FMN-binding regulatory protein PaiB
MYLPRHFEVTDDAFIDAFVRQYSFATLVSTGMTKRHSSRTSRSSFVPTVEGAC